MRSLAGALAFVLLIHTSSSAVAGSHSHAAHENSVEREEDGVWRGRDADHYSEDRHNTEFDHEAILGSVKEAEEFDKLSPEESKRRLGLLLPKMDLNGDNFIDRQELRKWIMNSFVKLSREEAEDRMEETDSNRDGYVTWSEYLQDAFGVDSEDEVGPEDTGDTGMLLHEEKEVWAAADANGDGKLDINEFEVFSLTGEDVQVPPVVAINEPGIFTNPEEHEQMHPYLIKQTMREKDKNKDGVIDFQEFVGEKGMGHDKDWIISEKDKFDNELDENKDGTLSEEEIKKWIIPDNGEIAEEEVDHLFAAADDDHDDLLSYDEVQEHHDVFVGSEATDYGSDLLGDHFEDEL